MIFAGAESARFRSDPRFPVPGTAAVPVCASCGRCGLFVCTWNLLDARCCRLPDGLLPARFLPCAACPAGYRRLLSAACPAGWRHLPDCVACGVVWHFWHCGTRIVPGSFRCSRLFRVVPGPSLPGRGRPEKV